MKGFLRAAIDVNEACVVKVMEERWWKDFFIFKTLSEQCAFNSLACHSRQDVSFAACYLYRYMS